ncbi:MAG: peptide deformylase [Minisyncoccia bacterium]
MKKGKILDKDAPVLRKVAKEVSPKEIGLKKTREIIERMKDALYGEEDGVAIAAPQLGESLRIFMVRGDVLFFAKGKKPPPGEKVADLVFINPEILNSSKKKKKVEEGCLSIRWLYGKVSRSEKITIGAYNNKGVWVERGASGLLAQIFQHEIDHLDGTLFTDKAEGLRNIPPAKEVKFAYFGSSEFSKYVLEELEALHFSPALNISSSKEPLPIEALKKLEADVFVVASFGKILPKEILELPKHGVINVHPSLLPKLRGASPIQGSILGGAEPGVTIIKMDERVDHGPILAQTKVEIEPWPDHYAAVEEKLGRAGGHVLGLVLPKWLSGEIEPRIQNDDKATFTKLIKKEDGLIRPDEPAEESLRKVFAYSTWPGAYLIYKNKFGKEIRVIVKDAEIKEGKFVPLRVVPAGKREMLWVEFLRGN